MKLVFRDLDILAWSSVQPNQIFVDHMSVSSSETKGTLGDCSVPCLSAPFESKLAS